MNTIHGIKGSLVASIEIPREKVSTNDPAEMVDCCLSCTALSCRFGECERIRKLGKTSRKKYRKKKPPFPDDLLDEIIRMHVDGWRSAVIAREKGLLLHEVKNIVEWAEKEGRV